MSVPSSLLVAPPFRLIVPSLTVCRSVRAFRVYTLSYLPSFGRASLLSQSCLSHLYRSLLPILPFAPSLTSAQSCLPRLHYRTFHVVPFSIATFQPRSCLPTPSFCSLGRSCRARTAFFPGSGLSALTLYFSMVLRTRPGLDGGVELSGLRLAENTA